MNCCILRKVAFREPEKDRLVWAIVLAERQGLALLYIPQPNGSPNNRLAFCAENVPARTYELVNCCQFPLEANDLQKIGRKLQFLSEGLAAMEIKDLICPDDLDLI